MLMKKKEAKQENIDSVNKNTGKEKPLETGTVEYCLSQTRAVFMRGRSNNVESDILHEHAVRNQKAIIKQLGANKTQKAIESASAAAGGIAAINDNIVMSLEITSKSSRHTTIISPGERQVVFDVLEDLKPFKFTPERKFEGFGKLGENVFACIDGNKMKIYLDIIVNRLLSGHVDFGNDDNDSSMDSDSDDDDLPDL
ncbi:unnamed protein product [Mytilus coruscus]|uniref:Uncharacterized protein n=1 Tax=Mytilus coruscus TaxID=42192 RepID=A0A6J8EC73_MYTCO|nr:unnamed protein product [Mytilus coruscus]